MRARERDVARRGLRRFLHYLAQLSGDGELAFAFHQRTFGGENLAADFGPCETDGRADFVLLFGDQIAELPGTKQLVKLAPSRTTLGRSFLSLPLRGVDHLARYFAADIADLALQVADSGFARIVLDQPVHAIIGEVDVLARKTGLFDMLADQEALGDLHFLELGVAGKADHFHAVLQSRRNGVQHVGGGDEENLAQIVFHVQVMIHEHEVLFGIEHFEQRADGSPRKSMDILSISSSMKTGFGAGLLHHLDNLAG